ncbi:MULTISPECIES: hypothetical protein [Pseudomonas]|uniref:hypothetical protein n=1 Tax=Pseudomonas TaxID=286 RepID=UPI0009F18B3C|nr:MULTISPECIES: hypothetical protein [Pseudomonas]
MLLQHAQALPEEAGGFGLALYRDMLGNTAAQAVVFVSGLAERVMAAIGFGFNQAVFAVVGKTLITI